MTEKSLLVFDDEVLQKSQRVIANAKSFIGQPFALLKNYDPATSSEKMMIKIKDNQILGEVIDAMGAAFFANFDESVPLRLQILEIYKLEPKKLSWKSFRSKEAIRSNADQVQKFEAKVEPFEDAMNKKWGELGEIVRDSYAKITSLVEEQYDDATRKQLGDQIGAQAKKDAFKIVGKVISESLMSYNRALNSTGIELGVPRVIMPPSP